MAAPKVKTASTQSMEGGKGASKPPKPSIDARVKAAFLKKTGYRESDILSSDYQRYTFVTKNGGKYQLNRKGTEVKVLQGPLPPRKKSIEAPDPDVPDTTPTVEVLRDIHINQEKARKASELRDSEGPVDLDAEDVEDVEDAEEEEDEEDE